MANSLCRAGFLVFFSKVMRIAVCILSLILPCYEATAAEPLAAAKPYRALLTRNAQAIWGADAPIAAFAAQITQESAWNPHAISHVGAQGLAQFMPATARWWCQRNGQALEDCQPNNPAWAIRAMVAYDHYLFERVPTESDFDRLWAALRGYNGGLGHWMAEARSVRSYKRHAVDAACGQARRSRVHCPENLNYPKRILLDIQPRFASWGRTCTPQSCNITRTGGNS